MKWVASSDQLAPYEQLVLVLTLAGEIKLGTRRNVELEKPNRKNHWFIGSTEGAKDIPYWCAIPPIPEKDDHAKPTEET